MADARAGQASRARRLGEEALRAAGARTGAQRAGRRAGHGAARGRIHQGRAPLAPDASRGARPHEGSRPRCWRWPRRRQQPGSASWRPSGAPTPASFPSRRPSCRGGHVAGGALPGRPAPPRRSDAGARRQEEPTSPRCSRTWKRRWPDIRAPTRRWRWPRRWSARVASGEATSGSAGSTCCARRTPAEFEPARRGAPRPPAGGDAGGASATRWARSRCSSSALRGDVGAGRAVGASSPGSCARRLDACGERARLLRSLGRSRELAAALEKDAGALQGDARLAVLAEHASLLDAAGEAEKALDVRLMALAEFPGAPAVLDDARARLESDRAAGRVAGAGRRRPRAHRRRRRSARLRAAARRRRADRAGRRRRTRRGRRRLAGRAGARSGRRAGGGRRRATPAGDGRLGALRRSARLAGGARADAAAAAADGGTPAGPRCSGGWPSCGARASGRRTRRCASTVEIARRDRARAAGRSPIRPSWRRSRGAMPRWPWRPRAPPWRRRPPTASRALLDRARAAARARPTRRRRARRAGGARSRSAQHRRARRARAALRGRARGPVSWPTSCGRAPPRCRPRRRRACCSARAAPRSAPAIAARRARPTGARCRWIPTLAEPIAALGALAAREGDWSRSRSCSRARSALARAVAAQGPPAGRARRRARRAAGEPAARHRAARRRGGASARGAAHARPRVALQLAAGPLGGGVPRRSIGLRRAAPRHRRRGRALLRRSAPPPRRPGRSTAR